MSMDFKKDIVYQQLRDAIVAGKYLPDQKFPNELDFARDLNVGKVTLRSALTQLEADGLVVKIPRRGTFVTPESHTSGKKFLAVIPSGSSGAESPWHYIMPGIEEQAKQDNITIEKCSINFLRSMGTAEGVEQLISHKLDGIFYFATSVIGDEQGYITIKATGLPVIMPHGGRKDYHTTGFAVMRTNERSAWEAGIKYLADKGHHYIATIWNGNEQKLWRGFTYNQYFNFLAEQECSNDPELVAQCRYNYDEVEAVIKRFMDLDRFPTAIICHSDFYALHVYRVLKQLNIKIPHQVAVLGYSNYPGGKFCSPALSTIDLQYQEVGQAAVRLMSKANTWHRSDTAKPLIYTPYRLLERDSSNIKRIERKLVS